MFTLLKGEKVILAEARSLAKTAKTYRQKLNILLCSAAGHASEHGDTRIIDQVFALVDEMVNRRGITAWIRDCSNISIRVKDGATLFRKPEGAKLSIDMDKLMAKPFWDYSKETVDKVFNFNYALQALIKRGHNMLNEKKELIVTGSKEAPKPADTKSFEKVLADLEDFAEKHIVKAASNAKPRKVRAVKEIIVPTVATPATVN
jgi:hypothetical protein